MAAATGIGGWVAAVLPATDLLTAGLSTAGLEVAGFEAADWEATGFESTGFEATGLDAVGLRAAGLEAAGLETVGLETAVFSAAFAVCFSISLLLFLEDFAAGDLVGGDLADGDLVGSDLVPADLAVECLAPLEPAFNGFAAARLAVEVLMLDDLAESRAALADPCARFPDVPRPAVVVFPAPFETLFLRVFCDTTCARKTLAPLFKFSMRTHQGQNGGANRVRLAEYA